MGFCINVSLHPRRVLEDIDTGDTKMLSRSMHFIAGPCGSAQLKSNSKMPKDAVDVETAVSAIAALPNTRLILIDS